MKRFLIQISLFTTIVFLILVLAITGTYLVISSVSFRIPEDKTMIIVGDSHPECAIDDGIFSPAINFAKSGNEYLYSYIKLRKFIEENSHIDKVLLSFHSDSRLYGGSVGNLKPMYISLLHKEEILLFLRNKPSCLSTVVKTPVEHIRSILKYISGSDLTYRDLYIGGYQKIDRDKLKRDIELREKKETMQSVEYSQYQLDYLLKIVALCHEKGVELILINTPTYNADKYGNKSALTDFYNTYLSGIPYLDYSDFPLPEYGYGDIGHLNYKGAELFSRYLEDNYESIFEQ